MDWGLGRKPRATDKVRIAQGDPVISTNVGSVSALTVDSPGSLTIDAGALSVTGLIQVGVGGDLDLENGAALTTTGALANWGAIELDEIAGNSGESDLTIGGALSNNGSIAIGGEATLIVNGAVTNIGSLVNGANLTATGALINSGNIVDDGGWNAFAISAGALTNTGSIVVDGSWNGYATSPGAETNAGSISLAGGSWNQGVTSPGAMTNTGTISLDGGSHSHFYDPSSMTTGALTNSGAIYLDQSGIRRLDLNRRWRPNQRRNDPHRRLRCGQHHYRDRFDEFRRHTRDN